VAFNALLDGTIDVNATQETYKVASVIGSADPEVKIHDSSSVVATHNLTASAKSDVTINASATPTTNTDSTLDASVVVTTYSSGATFLLGDSATVTVTGTANIDATSILHANASANADIAGKAGAGVAVAVISGDTTATIGSNSHLTAANVAMGASSDRTVISYSKSSPGGSKNGGGTSKSQQTLANNSASTSDGGIQVAGAVSVNTMEYRYGLFGERGAVGRQFADWLPAAMVQLA